MLNHGYIVSTENDVFVWQTDSDGEAFFITTLSRETAKKKIGDALSAVTGRACIFEPSARSAGTGKKDDSEEAYISRLYETFGKEPVIIKDKPEDRS